jgi:hypothetical protein
MKSFVETFAFKITVLIVLTVLVSFMRFAPNLTNAINITHLSLNISKTFTLSINEVLLPGSVSRQAARQDWSTTVVSIYFELNNSKHSPDKFNKWMKTFAVSVQAAPLAMIVDEKSFRRFKICRKKYTTKFYVFKDVPTMFREIELERNNSYFEKYMTTQNDLDKEKFRHHPYLYILWNSKSFIANKIAQENPFNSSYFLYTDMGAFRSRSFTNWPDTKFISNELGKALNDRIMFGDINEYGSLKDVRSLIEGTFFFGSSRAVRDFYNHFWEIHDKRFKQGLFVGKDQDLMERIAFQSYNTSVVRLQTWNFPTNSWFYYQVGFFLNSQIQNIPQCPVIYTGR